MFGPSDMDGTHQAQGYFDPWAMLQATRRASVVSGVDNVNQGVAGFRLGARGLWQRLLAGW